MKSIFIKLLSLLTCVFVLAACTPNITANSVDAENLGHAQNARYGRVVQAAAVEVKSASADSTGTFMGTAAGATAGSAIGGGTRMNILGAIGGALIGGITGHEVGKHAGTQTGVRYVIKLDNGKMVSIIQGGQPLHVGQRVIVLTGGSSGDKVIPA
jgi:outer membrane lipoprotein SlyB